MTRIAILTPNPEDLSYASHWPGVLSRLSDALALEGITARPHPWTDHDSAPGALVDYPLIVPVIVWGYHREPARWAAACRTWAAAELPLANPARVVGWNADKSYLGRLAERGVAIPPTIYGEDIDAEQVRQAQARFDGEVIVKPVISGGAWRTLRLGPGDDLSDLPPGQAMIQPFLPAIESEGELSLLFFGGELSHAVRKRPSPGDFRIQVQFGGLYAPEPDPPAEALELARATLAAIDEALLYARIDMVRDPAGRWVLMEAELIEPDFYLDQAPDQGRAFARAVRARLAAPA